MHRRPIGRGRWIVAFAAVVLVAAGVLGWWSQPIAIGLPGQESGPGIADPRGLIVFLVGIAALMLIALPYAADGPVAIDRPFSFLVLLVLAAGAYIWRVVEIVSKALLPYPPSQGLGFWLAAAGLLLFSRGVFEIFDRSHPE